MTRWQTIFRPLLLMATMTACAEQAPSRGAEGSAARTRLVEPENAISEGLMLGLSQARNYHHKADILVSEGKIDEAAEAVGHVLSIEFPASAEREDVMLDTRARLAKLRIRQGRHDDAMTLVDEGIAMSKRASFFLANLHSVRGEAWEAIANSDETDADLSRHAKIEAIRAFDASIEINKHLLKKLNPGPTP